MPYLKSIVRSGFRVAAYPVKGCVILSVGVFTYTATPASAAGWQHAAAPMGQFEGSLTDSSGHTLVTYGCSGLSSRLQLWAEGAHVAPGESKVVVDQTTVATGDALYNSGRDTTSFTSEAKSDWGQRRKDQHNALLDALASGTSAEWHLPDGTVFMIDLAGSSEMKRCRIR
ncbi:hypothetical protein [Salipiger thiooxidans]|uniref:hypothetical protein n=1 Tax=Salipiger thiooxidans TaxID=282683 RepID=UPI001CFB7A3B|nr:hypothetical protein [Salipiger thiooxidans]